MPKEWEEFFKKVTYKPNFNIFYDYDIDYNIEKVCLQMRVPDSRHENVVGPLSANRVPLIPVEMTRILPQWVNEEYAKRWTRQALRELEMHELDEWFRFEGELVNDPHAWEKTFNGKEEEIHIEIPS